MSNDRRSYPPPGSSTDYQQSVTAHLIRPPVGFAWHGPGQYGSPAPQQASTAPGQSVHDAPEQDSGKKKRSRDKGNDREKKEKSKSRHEGRSHREPQHAETQISSNTPPTTSPSFRIRNYSNEPSPSASVYTSLQGHHMSHSPPNYSSEYAEPRQSYYRHDYDRQREEAPSRHAYPSKPPPAEGATMAYQHSHGVPQPPPQNVAYLSQHERHPSSWVEPQPAPSYDHMPLSPQSRYSPGPAGREPYVADQTSNPPNRPRTTVRMLTLLIEDVRTAESQLAEIKVPLKPAAVAEDGFWANAKEVTDTLQISPSRIEGPARVSTMRGKYKQIFLRVSANGDIECMPANLKVSTERTLEVLVEHPQRIPSQQVPLSALGGMLTPVTDPMVTASPSMMAPQPVSAGYHSPGQYGTEPDSHRPSSSRKRRRSEGGMSPSASQARPHYDHYQPSELTQHDQRLRRGPSPEPASMEQTPQYPHTIISRPSSQQRSLSHTSNSSDDPRSSASYSSGSSSAPGSPSHSRMPQSHGGSVTRVSTSNVSNPSHLSPGSQRHKPAVLSSHASGGPDSMANTPLSSSHQQHQSPPPKKAKYTQESASAQRASSWGQSAASGNAASACSFSNTSAPPAGAFSNYSSASTFNIPTAPPASDAVADDQRRRGNQPQNPSSVTTTIPFQTEIDNAVSTHLRTIFKAETAWSEFMDSRRKLLPVSQQMPHLTYVQGKVDQYVGRPVPENVSSAAGTKITKAQVVGAFKMNSVWGDECTEVLTLSKYYGPNGQRCEDSRAVAMFDEPAAIGSKIQMGRYLSLLREVHSQWIADHPDQAEMVDASR